MNGELHDLTREQGAEEERSRIYPLLARCEEELASLTGKVITDPETGSVHPALVDALLADLRHELVKGSK